MLSPLIMSANITITSIRYTRDLSFRTGSAITHNRLKFFSFFISYITFLCNLYNTNIFCSKDPKSRLHLQSLVKCSLTKCLQRKHPRGCILELRWLKFTHLLERRAKLARTLSKNNSYLFPFWIGLLAESPLLLL